MHRLIVEKLYGALGEKGFNISKDETLEYKNGSNDVTRIVTNIKGKATCYLGLWIGKRFNVLESIVERYVDEINPGLNITDTLRISENSLKGIHNATGGYPFDDTEEGIEKMIAKLQPILKNKLLPFLDKYNTYEQLHSFANTPPDKLSDNLYCFSFDGMTQFRRMILVKMVNKDYDVVCNHVINVMFEGLKNSEPEQYERFSKVFYELKEELDRTEF